MRIGSMACHGQPDVRKTAPQKAWVAMGMVHSSFLDSPPLPPQAVSQHQNIANTLFFLIEIVSFRITFHIQGTQQRNLPLNNAIMQ